MHRVKLTDADLCCLQLLCVYKICDARRENPYRFHNINFEINPIEIHWVKVRTAK